MLTTLIGRALVASALTLTVAPSFAASSATEVYLANVRLDVDFLAASSKIATGKARSDALKHFADDEMIHQGDVLAALDGWRARTEGATPSQVASLPLETGRSVADPTVDVNKFSPPPGIGVLMPAATMTLDRLASLDGAAFDRAYTSTQVDALKRLEGFYDAYSRTGEDADLRVLATGELAKVRGEIAALGRV